jgi:hypothetical protein
LKKLQNNKKFKIYSLALTGGTLENHIKNLRQYQKIMSPDIIVYGMYHNDIESIFKPLDYSSNFEEALFFSISILRKVKLIEISKLLHQALSLPDWQDQRDRAIFNKKSWHWLNFRERLLELKGISDKNTTYPPILISLNGSFGTNTIDYSNPPKDYKRWTDWHLEMEKEACQVGYFVFNQLEGIQNFKQNFLAVNENDYHPNEQLHKLYAKNLEEKILMMLNPDMKYDLCYE